MITKQTPQGTFLWQCIHREPDGLTIFRQHSEIYWTYGNGFVVGAWYYIKGDTIQIVERERFNHA